MKTGVAWGERVTNGTRRVAGDDLAGVLRLLRQQEEWGLFKGDFTYKYHADGRANVIDVTVSPTFRITMPVWKAYRRQAQECQGVWDAMWRALKAHELEHRRIFVDGINQLVETLEGLAAAKGAEIDKLMTDTQERIQGRHDGFDTRTDHGASAGVELRIPPKCRPSRE